ncbi:MAG: hypothetical protein IKN49_04870 [Elusimicrobiaceae bacterium]|nr:hypothetical protein [Elusimicrobiaceae bacterium]
MKQIKILLWVLVILLITPPILRHFNVDVKAVYRKILAVPENSSSSQDGSITRHEVSQEVFDELFNEPETPQERDNAKNEFEKMLSGLESVHKDLSVAGSQVQEVPSMFRYDSSAQHKVRWVPPPPGFMTAETYSYLIYRQDQPVTDKLKTVLDNIHGNLMLDLTPFTLVMKPNKVLIMLFGNKDSYMDFTKRPSWSGAASDLRADTMYVLEGKDFYQLSVHELTHLYFDGYFLPSVSPLWLSEGMAVYMQINVTNRKPSWVDDGLQRILAGKYIQLEDLMNTNDISSLTTQQAELWYTESYSIVDYLLNSHSRDEFYRFCNELKDGTPVYQALYRAYGMPFNKISVLQNVWLFDLSKKVGKKGASNSKTAGGAVSNQVLSSTQTVSIPVTQPTQKTQQHTVIPKLKMVPTNGYQGNF